MTDIFKKWNIYTSIYLFKYCVYSWRNLMWMHIHGFMHEDIMRELFWHYLNYGNTMNGTREELAQEHSKCSCDAL